jgi:hypothetical protein
LAVFRVIPAVFSFYPQDGSVFKARETPVCALNSALHVIISSQLKIAKSCYFTVNFHKNRYRLESVTRTSS